jgi:ABC-type Fe3+-siderophore transport system permease subunit
MDSHELSKLFGQIGFIALIVAYIVYRYFKK